MTQPSDYKNEVLRLAVDNRITALQAGEKLDPRDFLGKEINSTSKMNASFEEINTYFASKERVLVKINGDSEPFRRIMRNAHTAPHFTIDKTLQQLGLAPEKDYQILRVGKGLEIRTGARPEYFLLFTKEAFHSLADQALDRMIEPQQGAAFFDMTREQYENALRKLADKDAIDIEPENRAVGSAIYAAIDFGGLEHSDVKRHAQKASTRNMNRPLVDIFEVVCTRPPDQDGSRVLSYNRFNDREPGI